MSIQPTSPIIVLANRLPFAINKCKTTGRFSRKQSAGGLVTAVAPVVIENNGLWVGWPGVFEEDGMTEIPESDPNDHSPTAGLKSSQILPVILSKSLFEAYYNGTCNATFWPLLHSMPDRALFCEEKWQAYRTVNEHFAMMAVEAVRKVKENDPNAVPLVWIHDYHLMLAPNYIRNVCEMEGLQIKIAFFLHTPFPSWDIMRLFPWDDDILLGILGCDSVGFHIEDYCRNFLDCCQRRLGCKIERNKEKKLVEHCGVVISVNTLPISIPYGRFQELARSSTDKIVEANDVQIILGVDRLDYTKGIVHRIKAIESLFETYPEHKEKVVFLQVVVPSRTDVIEYQELKEQIDQLVGKINGRFATPNWSPIRYIYGCVPQSRLAAYYRDASVALVTPLRDGMNLVAKEFVACQTTKDRGVLILSHYAGAGITMLEALLVNPYNHKSFVDTIHRALTMTKDERDMRLDALQSREQERDVNFWLKLFLKTVDCLKDEPNPMEQKHIYTEDYFDDFLSHVDENSTISLLLDYDGTLAPIARTPELAYMPDETRKVLERLSRMPDINIAIMSGRSLDSITKMVDIEDIVYSGNHGFEIQAPYGDKIVKKVPEEYKKDIEKFKERISEVCTDGAFLEDKVITLSWHYRCVPDDKREALTKRAREIFKELNIKLCTAHMAYEVRPPIKWNKGEAAIEILRSVFEIEQGSDSVIIYAGDDDTDEDAIRALKGMAVSFRIAQSRNTKTQATHTVNSIDAILTMLRWVERKICSRAPASRSRSPSISGPTNGNGLMPPIRIDAPRSPSPRRALSMMSHRSMDEICPAAQNRKGSLSLHPSMNNIKLM